jgi:hypothetical protein
VILLATIALFANGRAATAWVRSREYLRLIWCGRESRIPFASVGGAFTVTVGLTGKLHAMVNLCRVSKSFFMHVDGVWQGV